MGYVRNRCPQKENVIRRLPFSCVAYYQPHAEKYRSDDPILVVCTAYFKKRVDSEAFHSGVSISMILVLHAR
jgi:hypothetical protein